MEIIALISGKGGVGKSTLAANLSVGLHQRGKSVLLLDLDPQNAQRLHMGLDPGEIAGLAREGLRRSSVFESPFGPRFVPFGRLRESELEEFEAFLRAHPQWVAHSLELLREDAYDYVVIDTPPGPTVYLQQALQATHRALIVLAADAASFATIPKIQALVHAYTQERKDFVGAHLVLNQMPQGSRLGHQVRTSLMTEYAPQLCPITVHRDAAVAQALAFERPVLQYEANCPASVALQSLADWVIDSSDPQ